MRKRWLLVAGVIVVLAGTAALLFLQFSRRYVAQIRGPAVPPPTVAYTGDTAEFDALLEQARVNGEAGDVFSGIDETIHVVLEDQVAYTVVLKDGRADIRKGIAEGVTPTLVVPLVPQMIRNLHAALEDQKLDEAEIFNFAYVLLVPCLQRIHGMFYFTAPGDKRAFKVDDYMHFRLKNPRGFTYHGRSVDIGATVLNVDGYFFYLPGLVGDPDTRYEFDMADALELYRLLVYDAERNRDDDRKLLEIGRKVQRALDSGVAHTRQWH